MILDTQISSLTDLLEVLPDCRPEDYCTIAKDMELQVEDFEKYKNFKSSNYTRNCIVRTEAYELILLCWEPGQITSIHCHGGEECWVYGLQGTIIEAHYDIVEDELVRVGDHMMQPGLVSYMNDDIGYHQLSNEGAARAMTLHLYMNPIDHCTAWDEATQQFLPIDLKYDTLEGRPVL